MPTLEQQRILELFKNSNPMANFAPQMDPTLSQDTRGGDPSQDYTAKNVSFVTEQAQPKDDYQVAIRNRLSGISELGQQQTQFAMNARQAQLQQQGAAYQSYGSGQGPIQDTQYQPGVGGARGEILKAVAAQNGVPYSWGGGNSKGASYGIGRGANTYGFDCSGLVQYAYAQVGIKMPRLAEQQATMGQRVSINQLRPGDLVAGPHHIAVYAGNGMMWEAPRTGLNVRLTPVRNGMTGVALNI